VAKKGANRPIFEGNMPPKKMYSQKWPLYDGHSMKAVNKRSEGCFVWAAPSLLLAPTYFIIALNMWFVSWELTLARVKASVLAARRIFSV
jgi:hypothetical protein